MKTVLTLSIQIGRKKMACVNPDGTLSDSAKGLLKTLGTALTDEEISKKVGQPLFKIRSSLREMVEAGLIHHEGQKYIISESGKKKI
jgi:predicted transcriptional regulator